MTIENTSGYRDFSNTASTHRISTVLRAQSAHVNGDDHIHRSHPSFNSGESHLSLPADRRRRLIDREELQMLDDESVLINIARGGVVNEGTLIRALQSGWIHGAALDVFSTEPLTAESSLWDLSNVIVTPHLAGSTLHYIEWSAAIVAENYRAFVAGELDAMTNRVV